MTQLNTKIYTQQGGNKMIVASGGEIEVQSGATLDVQSGATLNLHGSALTSTELGFIDGVTAGTAAASKAVVLDSNKDVGDLRNLDVTNLDAGLSGTAGSVDIFPSTASRGKMILSATDNTGDTNFTITNAEHGQATVFTVPDSGLATSYAVQSTAALTVAEADILDGATVTTAELNLLDASAQIETITEAGAISVTSRVSNFDSTGGTFAATLAAPDASMVGHIKLITMTVDNGDVTVALTNVEGGTAASTATFDAVGESLMLVGGQNSKWIVIKEFGVTLS
jgi:hypothetical protein